MYHSAYKFHFMFNQVYPDRIESNHNLNDDVHSWTADMTQ